VKKETDEYIKYFDNLIEEYKEINRLKEKYYEILIEKEEVEIDEL
jgi:radical SAM superfamily enzyme